jgi:hypothetical protein
MVISRDPVSKEVVLPLDHDSAVPLHSVLGNLMTHMATTDDRCPFCRASKRSNHGEWCPTHFGGMMFRCLKEFLGSDREELVVRLSDMELLRLAEIVQWHRNQVGYNEGRCVECGAMYRDSHRSDCSMSFVDQFCLFLATSKASEGR